MLGAQIELYLVIDLSVDLLALFEGLAHSLVGLQVVRRVLLRASLTSSV